MRQRACVRAASAKAGRERGYLMILNVVNDERAAVPAAFATSQIGRAHV